MLKIIITALSLCLLSPVLALDTATNGLDPDTALAKRSQNPIENMITLPLNSSFNFGYGEYSRTQYQLEMKPVLPISLSDSWNLITRIILPISHQPNTYGGYINGSGDINPTFFLSPAHPGKILWGMGPSVLLPTATNNQLGQGKYSVGPSAVVLTMPGNWVAGVLMYNLWSVGGETSRPSVNELTVQYFINYNFPHGWYLATSPIITADWTQPTNNRWTIPLGGGVGRVFKIGKQAMSASIQAYDNIVTPKFGGPSWQLQLNLSLLFPDVG